MPAAVCTPVSNADLTLPCVMQAAPVGVFDSGLGGLSVLRHIRTVLPDTQLLYFADSAYNPYGPRPEHEIIARSMAIVDFLLAQGAKALVVACNTATVAAIRAIRHAHPHLPLVGVEPGLKPGAAISRSRKVGVLATARTLAGDKFSQLQQQVAAFYQVDFVLQAGHGLVEKIERGELDTPATRALLHDWLAQMAAQGVDTLVLGCTHYPFVRPAIEAELAAIGVQMHLIDTGAAIARQLLRVLQQHALLTPSHSSVPPGIADMSRDTALRCYTSGQRDQLQQALHTLLGCEAEVLHAAV